MISNKFKYIFFDLDGTLLDSVPDLASAINRMLRELSLPLVSTEKVESWVGNGAKLLVQRALSYVLNVKIEELDDNLNDTAFKVFLSSYGQDCCNKSCLYPQVVDTLLELKRQGIQLALITNKPHQFTTTIMQHLGLNSLFSIMLSGDSLKKKKPDPLPLNTAMAYFSAKPTDCLMVGDSKSDVLAARAAGVPVVCVSYGYNHGEDIRLCRPDWLLDSMDQLLVI